MAVCQPVPQDSGVGDVNLSPVSQGCMGVCQSRSGSGPVTFTYAQLALTHFFLERAGL